MQRWDCYLFDLDGTIVDTMDLIYRCFSKLMKDFRGMELTREEVVQYIGLPYRTALEKYTGKLSEAEFIELRDSHKAYQRSIYKEYIKPCPGAVETVKRLAELELPLAVVTSRLRDSASDYLREFGLLDYFQHLVTPPDTQNHKPHPEPVLKALELLGQKAEGAVYVGDSIFDMQAGYGAGVSTVFTSWGHGSFNGLGFEPDYRVDDLRELLTPLAGEPAV